MESDGKLGLEDGYLSMGLDTFKIPLSMYAESRFKIIQKFKEEKKIEQGIILLQGSKTCNRDNTDVELLVRQESFFSYLFGVTELDFYGAINICTHESYLFLPRLPEKYAIWMGKIQPPQYFAKKYAVDHAFYVDEMENILHLLGEKKVNAYDGKMEEKESAGLNNRHSSSSPPSLTLYLLKGMNSDSGKEFIPPYFEGIEKFNTNKTILYPLLSECRVHKSKKELNLIKYVNSVSSKAHVEVMRNAKAGMMEYQLESIFLNSIYFHAGCRFCSYTCICASGENSSILHYGHIGAPNNRLIEDGDMCLFDMGGEYFCYGSDITCSFPASGKFSEKQKIIYNAVLSAQKSVFKEMKPGVSWINMHKLAEKTILEKLLEAGLLQGSVEEMMHNYLGSVFMPHGLGHFLGLDVHDVGGFAQGFERVDEPGLRSLRTTRILEQGMVITVEPGCYFIDALLNPAIQSRQLSKFLVLEKIEAFRGFGGVRLEDDVVVTADGIENLTQCPREIADLEAVMAGADWPIAL